MKPTATSDVDVDNSLDRVLVTRHDKIGDFVLALPLCWAIKRASPRTRLTVLVSGTNKLFAENISFIDKVMLYEEGWAGFFRTLKRLEGDERPAASVSCFIDVRLGVLLWMAGITTRICPATKLAQFFFNRRIVQRRSRVEKPEWAYNLDLGKALMRNVTYTFPRPLFWVPEEILGETPIATLLRSREGQKLVAFHPGSGGSSDGNLAIEDYLRLARIASQISGVRVVFTFGPDDQAALRQIRESLNFEADIVQDFPSLWVFCAFIQKCTLFVSTSTGPMHLAGAVNTRTLSFFGASLFASCKRWKPLNEPDRQHNYMLTGPLGVALFDEISASMKKALV